jgi:transcriptional regulator with XRE-family HTH domain
MIGEAIREIIKKNKLTYRQIASDLGIDHANLYHSLKKGANPEWNTIEKLLGYLGYEVQIVKSTHSTPRADPSTALRTSTRGMLRVDTERRLLPRFTKESIIEKTYSS